MAQKETFIELKYNGGEFKFEIPDVDDYDTWNREIDKNYVPNKNEFVETQFYEDFKMKLEAKKIYALVGRNEAVAEWLVDVNAKYELSVSCPEYFKDVISPEKYKELSAKIDQYNEVNRQEAKDVKALAEKYKADMKAITDASKVLKDKISEDDRIKVLTLSSTQLPLSVSLAIENFTPIKGVNAISQKSFGRESLIRYKKLLLEAINDEKDIDEIISELRSKF